MNFGKFGWVVTTGLLALLVRAGEQPEVEKIGFINIETVTNTSVAMEKNRRELADIQASWRQMGQFAQENPAFTLDQLKRFRELWTKEVRTPAEEAELAKLKLDAQFATKHFDELRQKPNPTPNDTAEMNDLGKRALDNAQIVKSWQADLTNQFETLFTDRSVKLDAVFRVAVAQVAKSKSLTLVFSEKAAAFGSIDITEDVRKTLDKNNK